MKLYVPLRLRVEKDTIVRITRVLKGKGTITVSEGQEVSPSDILGSASVPSGFRTLNLAHLLSVSPNEVQKYMKRSLGQRIFKGELLAYKSGLLSGKKVIVAPTDGIIEFINSKTGEVRLSFLPKKDDLPAAFYGIVEKIDKEIGKIIIRAQASILHGVCGSGRVRDGIIRTVGRRDELFIKSLISPEYEDSILVGGALIYKEVISDAISNGVSGIITGGINAHDYKGMAGGRLVFPKRLENDVGVSVVVCEGFGSIPIGDDIYEILIKNNGKFVSIDGNKGIITLPSFESQSMTKVRGTKLSSSVSSMSSQDTENQLMELRPNLRVRIAGNSYLGQQGKILSIDKSETLLPSGIKTYIVTVETKSRKLQVPFANCEVIL